MMHIFGFVLVWQKREGWWRRGEVCVDSVSNVGVAIDVSLEMALIQHMIVTCLLICLLQRMAVCLYIY
jgi:hypothetical protein